MSHVFRALTIVGKAGLIMLLGKWRKSLTRAAVIWRRRLGSGELAVSIGKAQRRENGLSTAHTEAEARPRLNFAAAAQCSRPTG